MEKNIISLKPVVDVCYIKKFLHRTGTFIAFLKLAADISNNQVGTYILFLTTF